MLDENKPPGAPTTSIQPAPVRTTTVTTRTSIPEHLEKDETSATGTVIATDMVFTGDLNSGEKVRIDGTVEGSIGRDIQSVVVGKHGRVKATICAANVTIEGRVDGDIHGDKLVELKSTAVVLGNVYCSCIQIESGANLNGTVTMV